ncbi:GNAT family N-acetyltransferase [Nocardioides sp.]|uniref:bifunctional acetate--CoA ligase family protein/GNAT family N-acetyltransferase n=1 Tax=Nocardioides sp. TaxID=35761 RepID=UPI002D80857C|nr:GNAT family N-acetyltransferase [Nocardioides sp.]HET8960848.1 GNAT family N-acetyltransferase [Nocardioides sp.]
MAQGVVARAADVLLADGRIASIRPMVPEDHAELIALHDGVGDDNLRLRFFSLNREAGHRYVDHLVQGTGNTVATLVATVRNRIVALATAERADHDSAEVALLVSDVEHGHGLGSLLLEHLAAACRDQGVRRFVAEVLPENAAMIRVFNDVGFDVSRRSQSGVVSVEMSTQASATAVAAADLRESVSEARSLAPLLHPRSVAVVGVRREGAGLGHAVLTSITQRGFRGHVFVVHPDVPSIDGVPAFPRLADVPEHIDLAIIAVPAQRVLAAVEDAADAGVSSVVVISSGLGELGPEGAEVQHQMVRVARRNHMRLVGPNCLGVMSNDPDISLNATFSLSDPPAGGLAVASQSGGVGIALLDVARELGLGVHTFISLGNKADVSGNDLLAAWVDDPKVTAAALYLESFGNAPKFARLARRFAERKPLLAVVGGRSAGGRRAGASHTAAAASPAVGVDALLAQAGVLACRSAEAMGRIALLLSEQPLPAGKRVAIVSNAGGLGVLAADAADAHGLLVPELPVELRAQLDGLVSGTTGTSNPIDLGAGATADHLSGVLEPLLDSAQVDTLLVVLVPTSVAPAEPLVEATARARETHPEKPVVLVGLGGLGQHVAGVTVYHAVDHAIEAIAQAATYAEWRQTPRAEPAAHDPERASTVRAIARDLLRTSGPAGWVRADDATRLLEPYGLMPVGGIAANPLEASELAGTLGFPVAVKVADRNIVHKTDRGLVRVGLESSAEVIAATRAFEHELGRTDVPVLVQPVVDGVEIALGVVRDPGFGPLVMVAAGGIATGILDDRAFLLPPFTQLDAARAIRSLRTWPMLEGYRGAARTDTDRLERVLVTLGELSVDVPEVAELDFNPVMCTPTDVVLVDVKIRLAEASPVNAGIPRQLRVQP